MSLGGGRKFRGGRGEKGEGEGVEELCRSLNLWSVAFWLVVFFLERCFAPSPLLPV